MEQKIKLYTFVDGVNDTPFPTSEDQIEVGSFTYNAMRMGGAPTISFDVDYPTVLDDEWNGNVYASFNGERYFLKQIPTSSYDNTAVTYKHAVELISERVALENVYFYDVVSQSIDDKPVSNSSTVSFSGDIHQFVARLNHSLVYAKLQTVDDNGNYTSGYRVIVDEDVDSAEHFISFQDDFFAEVLQKIYEVYDLPYYFVGKEIHIGHNSPEIEDENGDAIVFAYGSDDALISISKENSNARVINRATAEGSVDNIPYYYPNETALGDISFDTIVGDTIASLVSADKFGGSGLLGKTLTYAGLAPTEYVTGTKKVGSVLIQDGGSIETSISDSSVTYLNALALRHDDIIYTHNRAETPRRIYSNWRWAIQNLYCQDSELYGNVVLNVVGVFLSKEGGEKRAIDSYNVIFGEPKEGIIATLQNYNNGYTLLDAADALIANPIGVDVYFDAEVGARYSIEILVELRINGITFRNYIDTPIEIARHCDVLFSTNTTLTDMGADVAYGWLDGNGKQYDLKEAGISLNREPLIGDSFSINLVRRVNTQDKLMPSIYRETGGAERFYNAVNGVYKDEDGNDIVFANPYLGTNPKEQIVEFTNVHPTIEEMTNAAGLRIDVFSEFAYDEDDNDDTEEIDGELVYKHPYFFAKLRKFDGENGFNLFDHAIEGGEMTIEMTSGNCGACKFVIAVDEENQKNIVQVYESNFTDENGVFHAKGTLKRDENGNVRCGREDYQPAEKPQDCQQDTRQNEVWIALLKDIDTYGKIMPTAQGPIRPSTEDTFIITNISLPQAYILNAEKRLEREIIQFLAENNREKFNFSIKFSRIYLAEHPEVFELLNENTKISVEYNNKIYPLYVTSYTYKKEGGDALPEITVELADALAVQRDSFQSTISALENQIQSNVSGQGATRAELTPYFLQKNKPDVAERKITFREGLEIGNYHSGALGTGGAIGVDGNGNTVAELDFLTIRKKATFNEITIQELKNVGGELILSPAAMECSSVTELEGAYRCYFVKQNAIGERINNEFVVGDQARCQVFNMDGSRYYWRLVVGIGEDYIDLSKTDCDANSDAPLAGDKITSLGNRNIKERQAAIILSAYSNNAPSMTQYAGIDSYSLDGKMVTKFSNGDNVLTGKMTILPNSTGAANLADLEVGGANMIRNSGFTGDYVSKELADGIVLEAADELFSPALDHWEGVNATVQESTESQSGKEVVVTIGNISQDLETPIIANENYVLSFKAKGTSITYSIGGVEKNIELTDEYVRYVEKFSTINDWHSLVLSGTYVLCEVQLERGTVASAWSNNFKDNTSDRTYYQAQKYLSDAIHNKSTVEGALTLTQIVGVGDYANGEMTKMTGGMSGRYSGDDNNVAFWAGGDFASAMDTVAKFANDATYQPTSEELATMAKFVVTHGGRAILNDIILRGYVYAVGGVFNGTIYANNGVFSGFTKKTPTTINGTNFYKYLSATSDETISENERWFDLDLEKAGSFIIFSGFLPKTPHFYMPCLTYSSMQNAYNVIPSSKTLNDVLGLVGQQVIIINDSQNRINVCGTNMGCSFIPSGHTTILECVMETQTDEVVGTKWSVLWKITQYETPMVE